MNIRGTLMKLFCQISQFWLARAKWWRKNCA
jgi:hypothetical protein